MDLRELHWIIGNFNQVVTPGAVIVTDVFSLLEQINISFDKCYAAIDLPNAFRLSLLIKTTRSCLLSAGKTNDTPSLFFLGSISTLCPYVIN